jgi:hypothetical protein
VGVREQEMKVKVKVKVKVGVGVKVGVTQGPNLHYDRSLRVLMVAERIPMISPQSADRD